MSRNKSNLFKRINWKSFFIGAVAIVLVLVTCGITASLVNKYGPKDLNEDNLYTVECITLEDDKDGKLEIDVNEKTGAIVLNGKSGDTEKTYEIGKIDLEAGTYTLTAIEDVSVETVYVTITVNQTVYNFDIKGENTITIDANAEDCVITLHVMPKIVFEDLEILPVIVEGNKAADFYA